MSQEMNDLKNEYQKPKYCGYFGRIMRWSLKSQGMNMYQLGEHLKRKEGKWSKSSVNRYGNGQALPKEADNFIKATVAFLKIRHPLCRQRAIALFIKAYQKDLAVYHASRFNQ